MERIKRFFKDVYVFAKTYREGLSIIISVVIFFTFISLVDLFYLRILWDFEMISLDCYLPISINGDPSGVGKLTEQVTCGFFQTVFSALISAFVFQLVASAHFITITILLILLILLNWVIIISYLSAIKDRVFNRFKRS
tara:strand:- start:600 stop:1016 length:417 start_codon:yes stop_codon:yes gene_type:complete